MRNVLGHVVRRRESAILLALIVIMAVIGTVEPNFIAGSSVSVVGFWVSSKSCPPPE